MIKIFNNFVFLRSPVQIHIVSCNEKKGQDFLDMQLSQKFLFLKTKYKQKSTKKKLDFVWNYLIYNRN